MVKLDKPNSGPKLPVFRSPNECKLENATSSIKKKYDDNPQGYIDGTVKFTFTGNLWRDPKIRENLKTKIQNNRCCFCEKDITDGGTLEHFRPKGSVHQNRGESYEYPGYYWLTYSWSNWLYACQQCNSGKDQLFPLKDPTTRVRNHVNDEFCSNESPLLINPSIENPSDYLQYVGFEISPKNNSGDMGSVTIDTLKLDRKGLFEKRASHLEIYWRFRDAMLLNELQKKDIEFYNNWLTESSVPGKEFSYMMKCNLDKWIISRVEIRLLRKIANGVKNLTRWYYYLKK